MKGDHGPCISCTLIESHQHATNPIIVGMFKKFAVYVSGLQFVLQH